MRIASRAPTGLPETDAATLNDEANLNTFAGADVLFD